MKASVIASTVQNLELFYNTLQKYTVNIVQDSHSTLSPAYNTRALEIPSDEEWSADPNHWFHYKSPASSCSVTQ